MILEGGNAHSSGDINSASKGVCKLTYYHQSCYPFSRTVVFPVTKILLNHVTLISLEVVSKYPPSLCKVFKDCILKQIILTSTGYNSVYNPSKRNISVI